MNWLYKNPVRLLRQKHQLFSGLGQMLVLAWIALADSVTNNDSENLDTRSNCW